MLDNIPKPPWLRGYATDYYDWHACDHGGRKQYWRRQGLVEGLFDMDGAGFEGRADLNMNLHVEVRTTLDTSAFRDRIAQAWSVMRQQHVLMSAKALNVGDIITSPGQREAERAYLFTPCTSKDELYDAGNSFLDFMDDVYPNAAPDDFYLHLMNSGRAIDVTKALSRLIVLPFHHTTQSTFKLHIVIVAGHQIADGLTTFRWMNSFIKLLNLTSAQLHSLAESLVTSSPVPRLPPAQESLYPRVTGSLARQRWFWLVTRILRHTSQPNPASFPNPLRRTTPLPTAQAFPPKYPKLLNYSTPPLNNSYTISGTLPPTSTARLLSLCRTASISIGSGLFVLVALSMMTLHERLHPSIPLHQRLPFVGSFPLNPRPFLAGTPTTGSEDSLMLAFSDGITLPFLPSHLPVSSRFKLLGRLAHRQLKSFQKRPRSPEEELALGTKGSKFLLPTFYLASQDRWKTRRMMTAHAHARTQSDTADAAVVVGDGDGGENIDFQGNYPPAIPQTMATCGISSVGDRTPLISSGQYSLELPIPIPTTIPTTTANLSEKQQHHHHQQQSSKKDTKDLAADFRNMWSSVRPRDGEFLVGAGGNSDTEDGSMSLRFGVSFDGNVIDPDRAGEWRGVVEGLLEGEGGAGAGWKKVEGGMVEGKAEVAKL